MMPSRISICLDSMFLRFLGPSTITLVLSEFRSKKLEINQVFVSLRHCCSLIDLCCTTEKIHVCFNELIINMTAFMISPTGLLTPKVQPFSLSPSLISLALEDIWMQWSAKLSVKDYQFAYQHS